MPRILLLVDEFQEFFVEDDKIAQESALLLDRLVRQGRAFGIHIILGSQTLGGAYSLARTTIDQMAVRIALQCSEADAHLILSKENSEARLLSRPGEAIYNAANGLLEGNNLFQVVWLNDDERDRYLERVATLASDYRPPEPMIVFEGTAPAELSQNPWFDRLRAGQKLPTAGLYAWLGEAIAIKDPTAAVFKKQSGSNLVILGQNSEAAFRMFVAMIASLNAQIFTSRDRQGAGQEPLPDGRGSLLLVIASQLEEESDVYLQQTLDRPPLKNVPPRDLPSLLTTLSEELDRRQKGAEGPAQFLFLFGLQRLRDLRKGDDDFGFRSKGEEKPNPAKQFQNLLREGPPLGIHIVLWCDTLVNLQRSADRQLMREFEMRVLFQMSAADSSTLMDSPVASKLGPYRALFFTEDQGRLEKFRPYGLPRVESPDGSGER